VRYFLGRRRIRPVGPVLLAAVIVGAACATAATARGAALLQRATSTSGAGACGTVPTLPPKDPAHVLSTLSAKVRFAFNGYAGSTIAKSPYLHYKAAPKPWKIGYVSGSVANGWVVASLDRYKEDLAAAAKAGFASPTPYTAYQPSVAQQSPAAELRDYQSLVAKGVNAIILTPLSGPALAQAVTAAGKKGIVTVTISGPVPSPYAVNAGVSSFLTATMPLSHILRQIGGKGNVLIMRGIPGFPQDDQEYAAATSMLARCPNVKVAAVLNGGYENSVAKTQVIQWMSSHPGTTIDAVIQDNTMTPGIIGAFEGLGQKVPPISDANAQAASLAYEAQNVSKGYRTYGTLGGGADQTDAAFRVAMRVLAGYGPKITVIPTVPVLVTPANVKQLTPPGATTNSSADGNGPKGAFAPDSFLNYFFTKKGSPLGKK
jgi:ribose transport system substrate-binding protein